jgi:iron complex transport system substrate-binding protein
MRLLLISLVLLCSGARAAALSVVDDYGHAVRLARPAERIVSLSPHLTELAYDAGAGSRLVGVVEYSDFPPQARRLPRVGSDAGIDVEAVLALKPDLVLAWPNSGSRRTIEQLASLGLPVFRSEVRELADIARSLERLGELAGTRQEAARAAAEFRSRAARLVRLYQGRPAVRVFYQVWDRPIMTVNGEHLISKVMRLCGGENVFAALPLIAPEVDREAVLKADPEVIIAGGLGNAPPSWLEEWKAFPLAAAARGRLYGIAPELIERPTPRILEGAERMCRLLEAVRAARS